jgi:DNA invertase Pin-like site-specific DNA recombinase
MEESVKFRGQKSEGHSRVLIPETSPKTPAWMESRSLLPDYLAEIQRTTHAGKLIMTIFAGIAEFERDLIRERTGAGRLAAKKRGVRFGRPPKLSSDQEHLARRLVSEGKSVREIASVFKVHAATIYRLAAS